MCAAKAFFACELCGDKFYYPANALLPPQGDGQYRSNRIARSARDRHTREVQCHDANIETAPLAKRRKYLHNQRSRAPEGRQMQQKNYMQASRVVRACGVSGIRAQTASVGILCLQRRETECHMFSDTRKHLVTKGFAVDGIRMIHGVDCRAEGAEVGPSKCVMWAFQYKFLPQSLLLFAERPELEFAFFGEDDARVCGEATAAKLVEAARRAAPSACRLGWLKRTAHKDFGCQFTSFTKAACKEFKRKLDAMTKKKKPYAHLYSLDLWWKEVRGCKLPSGHALMKNAKINFVCQKSHALRGRH